MSNILIVDDSPIIHRLLKIRLTAAGHVVIGAGNDGNEAVALFSKHRPELVLMDITMPNCDGREALRQIMKIDPSAKVMMLSALAEPDITKECLKIGAIEFVSKERLREANYLEEILNKALNLSAAA